MGFATAPRPGSRKHAYAAGKPTDRIAMSTRTAYRFRYALRLVASVFLLSSPCGGRPAAAPVDAFDTPPAVSTPARHARRT